MNRQELKEKYMLPSGSTESLRTFRSKEEMIEFAHAVAELGIREVTGGIAMHDGNYSPASLIGLLDERFKTNPNLLAGPYVMEVNGDLQQVPGVALYDMGDEVAD